MADVIDRSANFGDNGCPNGDLHDGSKITVFQNYVIQKLLHHNPWWCSDSPSWCRDMRLSNEVMTNKAAELRGGLNEQLGPHNISCPVEIAVSDTFGRHLIASRDILPGEMLLIEPPLVLSVRPKSPPYCSFCFKRAEDFTCPSCGFFFCGPSCITDEHKEECSILQRFGFVDLARKKKEEEKLVWDRLSTMPPEQREQAQSLLQQAQNASNLQRQFDIIQQYTLMPLIRTLITMSQSELLHDITLSLQANVEENSQRCRRNQKNIVEVVIDKLQVPVEMSLAQKICSIWDTNGFEVPLVWGTRVHGLYPFASLITHDCKANTQQWFTNAGSLALRTVDHIPRGKMLTSSYTDPQWATMLRQDHLRISKQFTCTCLRCTDPTEFGTFLGSPLCPNCRGFMVSTAPTDSTAQWICSKGCSHTMSAKEVARIGSSVGPALKGIDPTNFERLNALSDQLEKQLHPSHHILLQLHVSNLRNITKRNLSELTDEELINMANLANVVMEAVRRLESPLTRLHACMRREDLRLRLETLKRFGDRNPEIKEQLKALGQQVRECELVMSWDKRMPDFESVLQDYHNLVSSTF